MATLGKVRDYDEQSLLGKTFDSGGSRGLYLVIKDFYGKPGERMASVDGLQGEARFNMGSLRLSDILDCPVVLP